MGLLRPVVKSRVREERVSGINNPKPRNSYSYSKPKNKNKERIQGG